MHIYNLKTKIALKIILFEKFRNVHFVGLHFVIGPTADPLGLVYKSNHPDRLHIGQCGVDGEIAKFYSEKIWLQIIFCLISCSTNSLFVELPEYLFPSRKY